MKLAIIILAVVGIVGSIVATRKLMRDYSREIQKAQQDSEK